MGTIRADFSSYSWMRFVILPGGFGKYLLPLSASKVLKVIDGPLSSESRDHLRAAFSLRATVEGSFSGS